MSVQGQRSDRETRAGFFKRDTRDKRDPSTKMAWAGGRVGREREGSAETRPRQGCFTVSVAQELAKSSAGHQLFAQTARAPTSNQACAGSGFFRTIVWVPWP